MNRRLLGVLLFVILLVPSDARAACTGPAAEAGAAIYNADHHVVQFCNGSAWIAMTGDSLWRQKDANIYYNGGYIGIGTDTPERALHIVGTGGISDDVIIESNNDAGSNGGLLTFFHSRGTHSARSPSLANDYLGIISARAWDGSAFTSGIDITARASTNWTSEQSAYLTISTRNAGSSAERLRITSDGKVGIGTTTPSAILQFGNNVDPDPTNTNLIRLWENSGTGSQYGFGLSSGQLNYRAKNHVFFTPETTSTTERMRITSAGNVGIGTTSPSAALHVIGSAIVDTASTVDTALTVRSGDPLAFINLKDDTQTDSTGVGGRGNSLELWANGAPKVYVLGTGDVGIGTSPSERLHVVGNGLFTGSVTGSAFYYSSDARLKDHIETVAPERVEALYSLRGVSFDWKKDGSADIGLIAQEVEPLYPELVGTGAHGMKSVKYGNLVPLLLEALKRQRAEIDALKARVDTLEARP